MHVAHVKVVIFEVGATFEVGAICEESVQGSRLCLQNRAGHNWLGLGGTIVDSMSTLAIMGELKEFKECAGSSPASPGDSVYMLSRTVQMTNQACQNVRQDQ